MSAAPTPFDLGASYTASQAAERRRFGWAPAEGWSSVLLLVLMGALVGWAIDDAQWVLGDPSNTDFLPWAGAFGVLWGFVGAKLDRGRLVAHGIGAILATTFLLVAIGSHLAPGADLGGMVEAVAAGTWGAFADLVIDGRTTTSETAHYLLVLGGLVWGTGQFSGYAAYAHHRPLSAVVVPGTILLLNVSITVLDQFAVLVVFTVAALLFLVRFHVADEERAWARHRIADVGNAVGLSLRAGLAFVGAALLAALLLTNVAASAPLAGFWTGLGDRFVSFGIELARLFPSGGPGTSFGGVEFGSTITVRGVWESSDTPILVVDTEPDAPRRKWRAATYDHLVGNQWSRAATTEVPVRAGQPVLAGTGDLPTEPVATQEVTYVVRGAARNADVLIAPGIPVAVDRDVQLTLVEPPGGGPQATETWFGSGRVGGASSYGASAAIPVVTEGQPDALTENRLRVAGTQYPTDVASVFTSVEPGTAEAPVRSLLVEIYAASQPATPYDKARAIESYLRDSGLFSYDTDVRDVECGGLGIADCFAQSRRGYCEHFATTMVMLLRVDGIPARLVEGYLPGARDAAGRETIRQQGAHAWVEVYFPGLGWVDFDPTATVGVPQEIDEGPVIATPTPGPSGSAAPSARPSGREDQEPPDPGSGGGGGTTRTPGIGPIIVVIIPLAIAAIVALVLWLRRRLARPVQPEIVYRTVAGIAGRLGHPRRPTQTVYEYMGTLSDAVPTARPELQLVARSTVETAYGRRRLSEDRLAALGEAQRRLRFALLRLLLRRPGRRRR